MKHETDIKTSRCISCMKVILLLSLLLCYVSQSAYAQKEMKKSPATRASQYSYLPNGYSQIGTTQLYQKTNNEAIDIIGFYNGYYYSSTFGDYGYKLSVQVGKNSAQRVDCLNGTTIDGVSIIPSVVQQGELARVCYTVTNTNEEDFTISLGTHADVMIGNNDRAPISRRLDTFGIPYGLTMKDGNGAQLCVLFGSGLAGVTAISDFWFGYYYLNSDAYQMVGNYSSGDCYMLESGNYDSGMGWCWKDRIIKSGSTAVFSFVIGVGEVNLEPNSSFEVTPDDPEGWNDLSRPHRLSLNGLYESPAGLEGIIDYAVEDSEIWTALTDTLASGSEFSASLVATFDTSKPTHKIKFRTRDLVGNTTMLHPIEYIDVSFHELSGIEDKTFTGDSLYQTNITCDLDEDKYVLKGYTNNKNAGTASFNFEGVFPNTIGRKTYTFTIIPQPLTGSLTLNETEYVYDGSSKQPSWSFTEEVYLTLEADKDYIATYSDNIFPGKATLSVLGMGNYSDTLMVNFNIDKAPLTTEMYTINLPESDISYDNQPHAATVTTIDGVGTATISYSLQGTESYTTEAPISEGAYDIYLSIDEGSLYYGTSMFKIGSFAIYKFSDTEWTGIQALYSQLASTNPEWANQWRQVINSPTGKLDVGTMDGITIAQGHVVSLNLAGKNLSGPFPSMILTFPEVKVLDLTGNSFTGDIADVVKELQGYFAQYAPSYCSELQTLNITGNGLTGNIGLLAYGTETIPSLLTHFPKLTALWASGNSFGAVYPHLPSSIINLDLTKQVVDVRMDIDLSNLNPDSLKSQIPTIFVYNHQEQSYNTTPSVRLSNYPPTTDASEYSSEKPYWGVDAFIEENALNITCIGSNTYKGENGNLLYVSYPLSSNEVSESYCYTRYNFSQGDANFIGGVDITDLQATINYIFGDYQTYPFNFTAADTYKDGMLNVQDVVCTANIIISEDAHNTRMMNLSRSRAMQQENAVAQLIVKDGKIVIKSDVPIASFDITFEGNPEITFILESLGYDVISKHGTNSSRYVAYTLNEQSIPAGETIIAEYKGRKPAISSIVLADTDARYINANISDVGTSISISTSDDSVVEFYTLSGFKLEKPSKGINIKRTITPDGKVSSKVIIIK